MNGNWQWGRQIYNKDWTVQTTVSGCQMSTAGKTLTLLLHEWSNQMEIAFPTIMHIDTKDGSIKSSYSLEYNKQFESLQGIWGVENFETYGAILTDD